MNTIKNNTRRKASTTKQTTPAIRFTGPDGELIVINPALATQVDEITKRRRITTEEFVVGAIQTMIRESAGANPDSKHLLPIAADTVTKSRDEIELELEPAGDASQMMVERVDMTPDRATMMEDLADMFISGTIHGDAHSIEQSIMDTMRRGQAAERLHLMLESLDN
jgi:hypothetical protein